MRCSLNNYLNSLSRNNPQQSKNIFLLHSDTWHFNTEYQCVNCGITEPTIVNIGAGLAQAGKTVFIYGVCGFILYRGYDQIKYWIQDRIYKGNIIFLNAGANNCYPEKLGKAHRIYNDKMLIDDLKLDFYETNYDEFLPLIKKLINSNGTKAFIRLGFDKNYKKDNFTL